MLSDNDASTTSDAVLTLSFVPAGFQFEPWSVYAGIPIRRVGARNRDSVTRQAALLRERLDAMRTQR